MSVTKEITLTGTSTESWEDAALTAVDRAEATLDELQWVVVQDQSLGLATSGDPEFKTKVKIGVALHETR